MMLKSLLAKGQTLGLSGRRLLFARSSSTAKYTGEDVRGFASAWSQSRCQSKSTLAQQQEPKGGLLETLKFQRGVLLVQGTDRYTFLQGLVTNDVELLKTDNSGPQQHVNEVEAIDSTSAQRKCIYALNLNHKGRFEHDMFIYNVAGEELEESLLVDVDLTSVEKILKFLNRYKLRSKVKIQDVSDKYDVLVSKSNVWQDTPLDALADVHAFQDPRNSLLGYRLLLNKESELSKKSLDLVDQSKVPKHYTQLRYNLGIPEGDVEIASGKAIPLEYNMDLLNSISFTKGCYMGQELTARTHFQGLIRKRLLPVTISANGDVISSVQKSFESSRATSDGASGNLIEIIDSAKKKKVGNLMAAHGNQAFALLRLKGLLGKELGLRQKSESGEENIFAAKVTVHVPDWWPEEWYKSAQ